MELPELRIGKKKVKIPIIQGGMAVRISTGRLAGAVAREGAVGVIGASGMHPDELVEEIRIARFEAKGNGLIGVNIMFAVREFVGLVEAAVEEKADLILTGAGFSRDIFHMVEGSETEAVPIVSSARLALTSKKLGAKAVVVEGKEAGGHLGTDQSIYKILPEVRKAVGPDFVVIAAGGFYHGKQIGEFFKLGANGVQIASRFVLAEECNASPDYKHRYQTAKEEDVVEISSPVGMPGRAIRTEFVDKILDKTVPKPVGCDYCLKKCNLVYCIVQALINSQCGDIHHGIVFSGENTPKFPNKDIKPAAEILKDILNEYESSLKECKQ